MKRLILLLFALHSFPTFVKAQYSVDTNLTVNQYVEKLLGPGIAFSNAQLLGDSQAIGYFTDSSGQLGLEQGLILSTGQASSSDGGISNFAGGFNANGLVNIPELAEFIPGCFTKGNTNDGIILQLDFIPQIDSISIQYIFASEEYNEYVCSAFNDAFAIFISGPGINGEENLTFVPGSGEPITINSINNGSAGGSGDTLNDPCILTNAQYFNTDPPSYIIYDGYTIALTAKKDVIPCQTYRLRIMIADGCDSGFDSAVFLKAFVQESIGPTILSDLDIHTPSAYEDCTTLDITFSKPDSISGDYTFYYSLSGSAMNGIDYSFLPDSIIIPDGQISTSFSIDIYQDNQTEGIETIIFTYSSLCGDIEAKFQIDDQPILEFYSSTGYDICSGQGPVNLYVEITQGIPPYTYSWLNDESNYSAISVSPIDTTFYRIYFYDQCGSNDSVDFVVNTFPQPDPIILHFDTLTSTLSFEEPEGMDLAYWIIIDSTFQQVIQPQLTLTEAGSYAVYIDYINGCYLYSDTIQFNPTGIDELNQIAFKLYPNPASDIIQLLVPESCVLQVLDLAGKRVKENNLQTGNHSISVADLAAGIYFFQFRSNSGIRAAKVIVEH